MFKYGDRVRVKRGKYLSIFSEGTIYTVKNYYAAEDKIELMESIYRCTASIFELIDDKYPLAVRPRRKSHV